MERPIYPKPEFKKISPVLYEIPITYKKGMRVPARIYATEALLNSMDAGVFNQITNVASLLGIQKHAICMPDGHWGYGFPIGGVAAFDPKEGGVISPGGIGFDVNCLVRGSKVLTEHGFTKEIQDFELDFTEFDIPHKEYNLKLSQCKISFLSFDYDKKYFSPKEAFCFMKKKHSGEILSFKTRLGYQIEVTKDHPLSTDKGMVKAEEIIKGDQTMICPFIGVNYETPQDIMLISDKNLFTSQELNELEKRDLFPLSLRNIKTPFITKLFGYLLGDGIIYLSGGKGFVCAYGQKEDLKDMQNDFEKIGFSAKIYGRKRDHLIPTKYGNVEFTSTNYELHVSSKSLAKLFFALGYPRGIKTAVPLLIPKWIMDSPLWIKRLFLSGLFGAELSKPKTHTKTGFYCPTFQMNKNSHFLENGREFFIQIMSLLEEFKVRTHQLTHFKDFKNKQGETHTIRLLISAEEENLLRLFSHIGFSYNKKREILSQIAILYIKEKKILTQLRKETALKIKELRKQGLKLKEVEKLVLSPNINQRFVRRHYYSEAGQRITLNFLSFNEFFEIKNKELEKYGSFLDPIELIIRKQYDDYVYDFNIPDTHNFIANNILVSNCGMRLITTNLTEDEVKPKIKELVDALYSKVPAGVGCKGFVKVTKEQFKQVMVDGAQWCLANGYATKEDVECMEDEGKIKGADPSKVSDRAIKRGFDQIGTLGSGNHYLEIQVVRKENIFDKEAAEVMGINKDGQIVIMVHCGSRGFGHQIGTDYLKTFLEVMPKYGIKILDPELACAPFESKEGQDYYAAMACAANMAFANRQVILHRIREVFSRVFERSWEEMEIKLVYDVAHNIAKLEKHKVDGVWKELLVHRKGATRAFGPSRAEHLPKKYAKIGQPIILGGSMETGSYLLVGTDKADEESFASTAHGAGRIMSREAAKRQFRGENLQKEMELRGIYVHGSTMAGLAEEAGHAYKDIEQVVDTLEQAGITKRVVALKPIGNVKG